MVSISKQPELWIVMLGTFEFHATDYLQSLPLDLGSMIPNRSHNELVGSFRDYFFIPFSCLLF